MSLYITIEPIHLLPEVMCNSYIISNGIRNFVPETTEWPGKEAIGLLLKIFYYLTLSCPFDFMKEYQYMNHRMSFR